MGEWGKVQIQMLKGAHRETESKKENHKERESPKILRSD